MAASTAKTTKSKPAKKVSRRKPAGKKAKPSRKRTSKKPSRKANKKVRTCFVLMPFKEPFDTYYDMIIEPAIEATGLQPLRGDSLFRPSPIMADIWGMIQKAEVLVAELTEKNANVFYELGLGHAIGKPVILVSETIEDVPFDLQPLRVILYDKDIPDWGTKLRGTLTKALNETIADQSNAVPAMFRKVVPSQAPEQSKTGARLSALEAQLASLELSDRFGRMGGSGRSSGTSLTNFRDQIFRSENREEAVDATKWALMTGIHAATIRKVLLDFLDSKEADKVIELARQSLTRL